MAVEPDLRRHNDRYNAVGTFEFMMAHRVPVDSTEIIGTKGKLPVSLLPAENYVKIYKTGRDPVVVAADLLGPFQGYFTTEAIEFTERVLEDKPLPIKLASAVAAVKIGAA
ncbi:myo-inositol 2-dehydrogenase [Colletotrichum orchidophilum]|uniref:Myo-inositol 2-dehydrogenase n=1 Tax=Colletotrichum orchidophilum TaxID=1209926 RepID=A0A1G4BAN4_9PEZI|nr:myo-inositol 2-dehydrogenase [Colletotrichum orchidophilum]OHE98464.1 myo-inositol 2-dehydrogenase [Colletotrichum orchidophilum]